MKALDLFKPDTRADDGATGSFFFINYIKGIDPRMANGSAKVLWRCGAMNLRMVDARGARIAHDGVTKAKIRTTQRD